MALWSIMNRMATGVSPQVISHSTCVSPTGMLDLDNILALIRGGKPSGYSIEVTSSRSLQVGPYSGFVRRTSRRI